MATLIRRVDGTGPIFSLTRIQAALAAAQRACGIDFVIDLGFDDEGRMGFAKAAKVSVKLREIIEMTLRNTGSITVRYIGDLKPTVYPTNLNYFNSATQESLQGFVEHLKVALHSEADEVVVANLHTIRDIRIRRGADGQEIAKDINRLSVFADQLDLWASESADLCCIEDGN